MVKPRTQSTHGLVGGTHRDEHEILQIISEWQVPEKNKLEVTTRNRGIGEELPDSDLCALARRVARQPREAPGKSAVGRRDSKCRGLTQSRVCSGGNSEDQCGRSPVSEKEGSR